jgi:hypothetical protein
MPVSGIDLWVQASLAYRQRLQALFFPEGIAYDGIRFNRTAATAPLFNYLAPSERADEKMVSRTGIEPPARRMRARNRIIREQSSGADRSEDRRRRRAACFVIFVSALIHCRQRTPAVTNLTKRKPNHSSSCSSSCPS